MAPNSGDSHTGFGGAADGSDTCWGSAETGGSIVDSTDTSAPSHASQRRITPGENFDGDLRRHSVRGLALILELQDGLGVILGIAHLHVLQLPLSVHLDQS